MKAFFVFEVENTADGPVAVDIPSPVDAGWGAECLIFDHSDGSDTITVAPVSGEIDGETTAEVATGAFMRLFSDGEEWKNISGASGGGGAATSVVGAADTNVPITAAGTGEIQIEAPNGIVLDTTGSPFSGGTGNIDMAVPDTAAINLVAGDPLSDNGTLSLFGGVSVLQGTVRIILQDAPSKPIVEYGGSGATQMAHINTVDDNTKAIAFCEALRLYLIARGTMAAS
jgi:hypothetical protein